jgi:hypothetical protein
MNAHLAPPAPWWATFASADHEIEFPRAIPSRVDTFASVVGT